ncbi:DUF6220 domain-containing protein [Oerskovia sp. NPDC060338]|uniref:DUF6220 domain-containing protein n=1 Tax=Oerskovia sp. NPDC060338 TaxID=3347100 RepID=UPI003648A463
MRKTFLVISVLVVVAVVMQFYFAAVGVFSDPDDELFAIHGTSGRIVLPLLMILSIVFAALAKAGRRTVWLAVLGFGLLLFQTILFILTGVLTGSEPPPGEITTAGTVMLGFHALNGLAILGVTGTVASRARALVMEGRVPSPASTTAPGNV